MKNMHRVKWKIYMELNENMVCECKVNRIEELVHWIIDDERHMNDPDVPCKVQIILNFKHLWHWDWDPEVLTESPDILSVQNLLSRPLVILSCHLNISTLFTEL
jgi:hypothetical protein